MTDPNDRHNDTPPPANPATEELVAYLDGELDPAAAKAMAAKISRSPALRAEAAGLKRAWDVLDVLPRPQPSAAFLSRTVSQIMPAVPPAPAPAATTGPAQAGNRGWFIAAAVLIALGGTAGYVGRAALTPVPDERAKDAEMLGELSLLKNARLYRHVDDIDFLRKLDAPELFAEDD